MSTLADFLKRAKGGLGGHYMIRPPALASCVDPRTQRAVLVTVGTVLDEKFACPKEKAGKVGVIFPGERTERYMYPQLVELHCEVDIVLPLEV